MPSVKMFSICNVFVSNWLFNFTAPMHVSCDSIKMHHMLINTLWPFSFCPCFLAISKDGAGQLDLLILDTLYRVSYSSLFYFYSELRLYQHCIDKIWYSMLFLLFASPFFFPNCRRDHIILTFASHRQVLYTKTLILRPSNFWPISCIVLLQTLAAVKKICPKRALLIGMTHQFDHHKDNEFLSEWSKR